mgnify:CR=1 FL=1
MSRDPKLDLFDKILKHELGLEYKQSGDVQLNFFPDSTTPGVSVPLVLAGNTNSGVSTASTIPPLLGFPYAHIRNSFPASTTGGGDFWAYNDSTVSRPSTKIINGSSNMYWRSRKFTERVTDEIGIKFTQVSTGISGAPGTLLNFPTGVYSLRGRFPVYATQRTSTVWYNFTLGQNSPTGNVLTSGPDFVAVTAQVDTEIFGRFTVSSSDDDYCLIQLAQVGQGSTHGFGMAGQSGTYLPVTDAVYGEMEFWKIG